MTGPETVDWVARIARELEPLQHSWQRLQSGIEAAREAWRPHLEVWRQLSDAFVAARDKGVFRDLRMRLHLTVWMGQQFNDAKDNPSHRRSRMWLAMQHLTPREIAQALPFLFMHMQEMRIPKGRGRPRRAATNTLDIVELLDRRIKDTGELPTTAAKRLLIAYGYRTSTLKAAADHLVRVWKKRVLKSR